MEEVLEGVERRSSLQLKAFNQRSVRGIKDSFMLYLLSLVLVVLNFPLHF